MIIDTIPKISNISQQWVSNSEFFESNSKYFSWYNNKYDTKEISLFNVSKNNHIITQIMEINCVVVLSGGAYNAVSDILVLQSSNQINFISNFITLISLVSKSSINNTVEFKTRHCAFKKN